MTPVSSHLMSRGFFAINPPNGAASSRYPPVQQIWNSATCRMSIFDCLVIKGLTLCDWGAPPPKHHDLSRHPQLTLIAPQLVTARRA